MVNYQDSKIYRVVCDETNLTYYGSTTQPLAKRLSQHKKNRNLCMTKNMTNPKIYLVESFPCNTKEELHARERFYVEQYPCCNKHIPLRTNKEWCENNIDKMKEYKKEYRLKNKNKIIEWRENNKDNIKQKAKEYRQANIDKIKEREKEYREANKDKISEKKKVKITCECGSVVRKGEKSKHLKTKKHIDYISNLS